MRHRMNATDWMQIFVLGMLWGGSFFFVRIAVVDIHPLALVLLRVGLAALILNIWLSSRGLSIGAMLAQPVNFLILGLLNNALPFSLMFIGQTQIGAGLASILNATTPFWTALFAHMLTTDERITPTRLTGIFIGLAGTAVMIGPGLADSLGGPLWAKLALIGTAMSYGLGMIYARKFRHLAPPVLATGQLTSAAIIMLPVVFFTQSMTGVMDARLESWAAMIALATVSTAIAYILYFRLFTTVGATNTSLVTLIVPASAILLGTAFLGESLHGFEIGGMALTLFGLLVFDGRIRLRNTAR